MCHTNASVADDGQDNDCDGLKDEDVCFSGYGVYGHGTVSFIIRCSFKVARFFLFLFFVVVVVVVVIPCIAFKFGFSIMKIILALYFHSEYS